MGFFLFNRGFLVIHLLLFPSDTISISTPAIDYPPPNFLLLFLDDVGYGDIGANVQSVHETPHIDALAASGMLFTDMHAAFSVCTPSRAALLTGRLAPRTGVFQNFAPGPVHIYMLL